MTHYTAAALQLDNPDQDRMHGPSHSLERYTCGADTLKATTDEREQYEAESGAILESDELPADTFSAFLTWLRANTDMAPDA